MAPGVQIPSPPTRFTPVDRGQARWSLKKPTDGHFPLLLPNLYPCCDPVIPASIRYISVEKKPLGFPRHTPLGSGSNLLPVQGLLRFLLFLFLDVQVLVSTSVVSVKHTQVSLHL